MFVALAVATLSVVTLVVERLEVPVTLRAAPNKEAALSVVTLVVERLEAPVTFIVEAENVVTFPVVVLDVTMFAVEEMLSVVPKMNGIVKVSKLNIVFVVLDVKPVVIIFVV
jgi:hypothetical protein